MMDGQTMLSLLEQVTVPPLGVVVLNPRLPVILTLPLAVNVALPNSALENDVNSALVIVIGDEKILLSNMVMAWVPTPSLIRMLFV